jgi:hypothetical protein
MTHFPTRNFAKIPGVCRNGCVRVEPENAPFSGTEFP